MMRKTTLATVITLTASLFASAAMAAPAEVDGGTVNVNGNMVAAACTIEAGTKDQTVSLGTWDLDALKATKYVWEYGSKIPFSIQLTNCDSAISAGFSFYGTTHASGTLLNTASDNPSNLRLRITDATTNVQVNINSTISGPFPISNGALKKDYHAQYSLSSTPIAGNALYVMTYKLHFS